MTTTTRHDGVSLFNGPIEIGYRALVLLNETYPDEYSLRHLVIFDYLLVHSDDIENGPVGLHPKTPYRSGELLVRRNPLQNGLALFHSRGLIEKHYREHGVFYSASEQSESFLAVIEARYSSMLIERAEWVASRFGTSSLGELEQIVRQNLGIWGAEFEMGSVLWSEADDV